MPISVGAIDVAHVLDRLEHALAEVARRVAVAQLERLVLAGRRARGHDRAAERAAVEADLDFDGRVATGIQDFAGVEPDDLGHGGDPTPKPRARVIHRAPCESPRRRAGRTRARELARRACCNSRCRSSPANPRPTKIAVGGARRDRAVAPGLRGAQLRGAREAIRAHDDDVVVVQDGQPLIGWSLDRRGSAQGPDRPRPRRSTSGSRTSQVASLVPGIATAIATMTREISDGITTVTENGALTLVLRKDRRRTG